MKAVYLPGDKRVDVREVDVPRVEVGEVLVRVKASAICRSDLSLYYGDAVVGGSKAGAFITGHEPAGIVEEVGAGVRSVRPGDRVAIYLAIGCGHCHFCRSGNFHLCAQWECIGFTCDGGNAEFIAVPERNCLIIPEGMSFGAAAVSTDAFGTLYGTAKKLGLSGNTTVAIFGMGPMGSAGVLAAKAFGATVIAVDPLAQRRDFAMDLGADMVVDPSGGDAVGEITELTNGAGLDAAIDCSGNQGAQNNALDATRCFGTVAFIGEAREATIRPSDQLIRKQLTLMGSWYFNISDYREIARCAMDKRVPLDRLITHTFSLDEAPTAFRMFDNRETEKAVFVM